MGWKGGLQSEKDLALGCKVGRREERVIKVGRKGKGGEGEEGTMR